MIGLKLGYLGARWRVAEGQVIEMKTIKINKRGISKMKYV